MSYTSLVLYMLDLTTTEIGTAAAIQISTFLVAWGAMRSDLKNINGWLKETSKKAAIAELCAAELKGRLDTLPCKNCHVTGN